MATTVTISSDDANAIAALLLAANDAGVISDGTTFAYRAVLLPGTITTVRKFTFVFPAVIDTSATPGAMALADDGTLWYTADVSAGPPVWAAQGIAPQT